MQNWIDVPLACSECNWHLYQSMKYKHFKHIFSRQVNKVWICCYWYINDEINVNITYTAGYEDKTGKFVIHGPLLMLQFKLTSIIFWKILLLMLNENHVTKRSSLLPKSHIIVETERSQIQPSLQELDRPERSQPLLAIRKFIII
jgi:hypothetical protein